MRWRAGAAAICLTPLLAGCLGIFNSAEDPTLEAFEAIYRIDATSDRPASIVTVTMHGPAPYVAANGSVQDGYVVDVDWGDRAEQRGDPQIILDASFQHVRYRYCDQGHDGACSTHAYDWHSGKAGRPISSSFGIATNVAPPMGATVENADGSLRVQAGQHIYVFSDTALAPTEILRSTADGDELFATRTSYRPMGPLDDLRVEPAPRLRAADVAGPLFPGTDEDLFGQGFSLVEALNFLRSEAPRAAAILESGGCVLTAAAFVGAEEPSDSSLSLTNRPTQAVYFTVGNTDGSRGYRVTWGQQLGVGAYGFLAAHPEQGSSSSFDCGLRSGAASLASAYELAVELGAPDVDADAVHVMHWDEGGDGPSLWYQFRTSTPGVMMDASAAELVLAFGVPVDADIDP